jgi:quercetin dioxygenase-like cupin family protein
MAHGNEMIPRILQPGFRDAPIHRFKETAMFNFTRNGFVSALIAVAAIGGVATSAAAAQCPTGQEKPNALTDRQTMPKDVTDVVLGSIDLGNEIGVAGRDLRMRRLVVQPGGVVPYHSHAGRPALIITISGEITEYRSSCAVPITHHAGELAREADGIGHYWINNGKVPAVLLSADVKAAD